MNEKLICNKCHKSIFVNDGYMEKEVIYHEDEDLVHSTTYYFHQDCEGKV